MLTIHNGLIGKFFQATTCPKNNKHDKVNAVVLTNTVVHLSHQMPHSAASGYGYC
jgi:formamidopyrimidine-DNA glycosylase